MNQQATALQMLKATLGDIKLDPKELKTLEWMSGWEEASIINICTLIAKSKAINFKTGIQAVVTKVDDGTAVAISVKGDKATITKAFMGVIESTYDDVFSISEFISMFAEVMRSHD